MIVYIDTGIFFDYFIFRSHASIQLRIKKRRGRTRKRLNRDATECLEKVKNSHSGITSSFTLYELEHAVFTELQTQSKKNGNVSNKNNYHIISSRPAILQGLFATSQFNINIIDLNPNIFRKLLLLIELQNDGVLVADSIHLTSAIENNAEIILSSDKHILDLDNHYRNINGQIIRCIDTDTAIAIL